MAANISGTRNADRLTARASGDTVEGLAGNDTLSSATHAGVYLFGGDGNDTLIAKTTDTLVDGGAGVDTVQFAAAVAAHGDTWLEGVENVVITNRSAGAYDFTGQTEALNITGSRMADTLTGGSGDDTIAGGLGIDSLMGGDGDDVLVADATDGKIDGGNGTNTVRFAAAVTAAALQDVDLVNVQNVEITNRAGAAYDFSVQTEALNIMGGRGNDTITGGTQADTLSGGNGTDVLIASASDALVDGGSGNDTVRYAADVSGLDDGELVNVEYVVITDANGGSYDFSNQSEGLTITGTGFADTIYGGSGADVLRGGLGDDKLYAGENDRLIDGGNGSDTAYFAASVSARNLLDSELINVETVAITGTGAYDFSAQSEKLAITAAGLAAAVTITGSRGVDTLTGGSGNDVIVASALDVINGGASGNDTVRFAAAVSATNLADADLENIDNIVITNTNAASYDFSAQAGEAFDVTGGSGNDTITTATNTLDTLRGGAGNDTLVAEAYDLDGDGIDDGASDKFDALIDGGTGTDTVRFAANVTGLADLQMINTERVELINAAGGSYDFSLQTESLQITGSAGGDTIIGGFRNDTITGGGGADSIVAGDGVDVIIADASDTVDGGDGYDTVRYASAVASLAENALRLVENIEITNTNAASYDFSQQTEKLNILGGTAADTLTGGSGTDTVSGGAGADVLVVQDTDALIDGGVGIDTARFGAAVSAQNLIDADLVNVERVEIIKADVTATYDFSAQTEGLTITGNIQGDSIIGGAGADSISGANGNDTLIGGAGNDMLLGGDGQDLLIGGLGADSLLAGDGDDLLVVEDTDARIDGGANEHVQVLAGVLDGGTGGDTAKFAAGVSASNLRDEDMFEIERIEITNTTTDDTYDFSAQREALIIKGNTRNDIIIGGRDWDAIRGGGGNDTLYGGLGKDQFNVDSGHDTIEDLEVREGLFIALGASATATGVKDYSLMNIWGDGVLNINGTEDPDLINGSGIDDSILGGLGNDTIYGNAGDDTLVGGPGTDSLYGGDGDDVFLFPDLSDIDGLAETIDGGNEVLGDKIVLGASGTLNLSVASINEVEALEFHSGGNDVRVAASQIGASDGKIHTITGGAGADTLRTSDATLDLNGVTFSSIENLNLTAAGDTTLYIDDEDLGAGKITSISSADAAGIDALVTDDATLNVEDVTLTNIDTLQSTFAGSSTITVSDSQLRDPGITTITAGNDSGDTDVLQTNDNSLNLVGVTLNNIDKIKLDADNNGGNDTLTLNSADLVGLSAIEASADGNNNKVSTPDSTLDVHSISLTNIDTLESTFAGDLTDPTGSSIITVDNNQLRGNGVTTIKTTATSGDTDELRTASATLDLTDINLINIDKVYSTEAGNTTITMDDVDLGPPGVTIVGSASTTGTDILQTNDSTLDVSDVTLLNVDTLIVDADGNDTGNQTITVNPTQLGNDAAGKVSTLGSNSVGANVTLKLASPGTVDLSILNLLNVDSVQGSGGADNITGRSDDDTLLGGAGADTLDGGGSVDGNTLSFADFTSSTAYGLTGLTGIAVNLSGSNIAAADVRTVMGSTVGGTGPGVDGPVLEGGVSWGSRTWGTTAYLVSLANNSALMGDRDLVRNFTRVIGSDLSDYIVGSNYVSSSDIGANTITGGLGDDYIKGGTGIDTIYVTAGTDRIADVNAGDFDDIVVVSSGSTANITVVGASGSWPDNSWTPTSSTQNNGGTVNITIEDGSLGVNMTAVGGTVGYTINAGSNGDTVTGSTFADTIFGGTGGDSLTGGTGDDRIYAGAGNDTLIGELGDDVLYDVQGANEIRVGSGSDRVFFTSTANSATYTNKVVNDASNVTVMLREGTTSNNGSVDGKVDSYYVYVTDSDRTFLDATVATTNIDVVHFSGGDVYDTNWYDLEFVISTLFGNIYTGIWDGRVFYPTTSLWNADYDNGTRPADGTSLVTSSDVFNWASDGVAYDLKGTQYWPAPDAPDQSTAYESIDYIQTTSGWRGYFTFDYFGYTYVFYANAGDDRVYGNEMFYVGQFKGTMPTAYQFYTLDVNGVPTWSGDPSISATPPTPLRALEFADTDDNGDSSIDNITSNTTGLTFTSTVGSSNPVRVYTQLGSGSIVDQGDATIADSTASINLTLTASNTSAYKVWFVQAPKATYSDAEWAAYDSSTLASIDTLVVNVKTEVVKPVITAVTATDTTLTVTATDNVGTGLTAKIMVGDTVLASSSTFNSSGSGTITISELGSLQSTQLSVFDAAGNKMGYFGRVLIGSIAADTFTGSDTIANPDTVVGGQINGVDFIYGFGGNDTINGRTGADRLYGGDGNDTFQFASRIELDTDATVVGGSGTDTIEITTATTAIVDADFTDVDSVETLSLTGASSAVLGTEAAAAGLNKVDTGTGNTTITATVLTALTIASDVVDNATLILDVDTGDDVNFTVTGLKADLTVDNDHTGNVSVTLASVAGTTVDFGTNSTGTHSVNADALTDGQVLTITGSDAVTITSTDGDVSASSYVGAISATVGGTAAVSYTMGTVSSSIASSNTGGLTVDAEALADDQTLTLSGTGSFTVSNLAADLTSSSTGTVGVTLDDDAGTVSTTVTNNAGSGTLTVNSGSFDSGDTIVLAGTRTISVAATDSVSVTTGSASASISEVTGKTATVNATAMADAQTLTISGQGGFTITGLQADLTSTADGGAVNITAADVATQTIALGTGTTGTRTINASAMTDGDALTLTGSGALTLTSTDADVDASGYTGAITATVTNAADAAFQIGTANASITAAGNDGSKTLTIDAASNTANTLTIADAGVKAGKILVSNAKSTVTLADAFTGTGEVKVVTADDTAVTVNFGTSTTGTRVVDATAMTDADVLTLTGSDASSVSLTAGDLSAASYAGDLTVTATSGTNVITTGSGNDTITGGDGADSLVGGDGDDTFKFVSDTELVDDSTVAGGAGTDTIEFTESIVTDQISDVVSRVSSVERVVLFGTSSINLNLDVKNSGISTILTGEGNTALRYDTDLAGTFNVDAAALVDGSTLSLLGGESGGKQFEVTNLRGDLSAASFGGSISVAAASGTGFAISLTAGLGNDTLTGGKGVDTIVGGNGDDTIWGGSSWEVDLDSLSGGTGDDVFNFIFENSIVSDVGTESIDGGDGTDALVLQAASGVITLTRGTNNITNVEVIRFAPTPPVTGNLSVVLDQDMAATSDLGGTDSGTVRVEAATGSNFSTYGVNINATDFTSTSELVVVGTNFGGNDTMSGGAGNDTIDGGAGNDTITGGSGADSLTGGSGADLFSLTGLSTAADRDTVTDFAVGVGGDKVGLDVDYTSVGTVAGIAAVFTEHSFSSANAGNTASDYSVGLAGNAHDVIEFLGLDENRGNLSAATDGTELIKMFYTGSLVPSSVLQFTNYDTGVSNQPVNTYLVAYDDGKGYVYLANSSDRWVQSAEITLVGTFDGVASGAFTAANFVIVP